LEIASLNLNSNLGNGTTAQSIEIDAMLENVGCCECQMQGTQLGSLTTKTSGKREIGPNFWVFQGTQKGKWKKHA
jgi:hypothetical protein